jgi:hypothetical protein
VWPSSVAALAGEYFAASGVAMLASWIDFTIAWISASLFQRAAFSFMIRYVRMQPRAKSFTPS